MVIKGEMWVFESTSVVSLIIPESGLFADFVKRPKNNTCFIHYKSNKNSTNVKECLTHIK